MGVFFSRPVKEASYPDQQTFCGDSCSAYSNEQAGFQKLRDVSISFMDKSAMNPADVTRLFSNCRLDSALITSYEPSDISDISCRRDLYTPTSGLGGEFFSLNFYEQNALFKLQEENEAEPEILYIKNFTGQGLK